MPNLPPSVSRLDLPGLAGTLLLGPCPGRRQEMLDDAASQAALTADLSRLTEMGAAGLLSLVESKELPSGIDGFSTAVSAAGLEWTHLPIPDYGVPDAGFMAGWHKLDLARRLSAGQSWAIHCRAGLGRTGTVAALLLVEGGASAIEAIATIRRQHDMRAVETQAQSEFLSARAQMLRDRPSDAS